MKRTLNSFTLAACLLMTAALSDSYAQRKPSQAGKGKPAAAKPGDEDALKAELDEALKLDAATRVERLAAFVKANPDSPQTLRAQELLASARAALGDEKLRAGDHAAGVELFRAAVAGAPGRGARRGERDAPALGRLLLPRHRAARGGRAPRAGGRRFEARDGGRA